MSNSVTNLFKDNKRAVLFLLKFVGLYVVLNTIYGFVIESYKPEVDPITYMVSVHTKYLLSLFHENIQVVLSNFKPTTALKYNGITIIAVFEGCNSINVMIVFIVFIISYSGSIKSMIKFIPLGLVIIYMMNLLRVTVLFWVAYYFPNKLYFFHKYLFTAIIYLVVFGLWYEWIRRVKNESGVSSN
jgi:exosortase family protein XrtF